MNNFLKKLSVEWVLRVSMGLMYAFSGIDLIYHTKAWYWAVRPLPIIIQNVVNKIGIDQYLKMQGVAELALAGVLLFKFVPRSLVAIVAGLTVIEMAVILFFVGVDAITFRDISILGAALALYIILVPGNKGQEASRKDNMTLAEKPSMQAKGGEPVVQTYDQFIK